MYLGRVVGSVWCTAKDTRLTGKRMVVIQPLTPELTASGAQLICVDSAGAGSGELIYWVRGREASFPFGRDEPPVDTTVVGIVDQVHVQRTPPAPAPANPRKPRKRSGC